MKLTECERERVSIISESLKITMEAAFIIWQGQTTSNPFAGLEDRAKALKLENKMKRHAKKSGKDYAGGE